MVGNFTCEGKNYAYSTLLYGFSLFSLSAGNSIVPNRFAVLEDRPYNRDVEMQELVGGNTRSLELF